MFRNIVNTLKHWYQRIKYGISFKDIQHPAQYFSKTIVRMSSMLANSERYVELYESYNDPQIETMLHQEWNTVLKIIQMGFLVEQDIAEGNFIDTFNDSPEKRILFAQHMKEHPDQFEGVSFLQKHDKELKDRAWYYLKNLFHEL